MKTLHPKPQSPSIHQDLMRVAIAKPRTGLREAGDSQLGDRRLHRAGLWSMLRLFYLSCFFDIKHPMVFRLLPSITGENLPLPLEICDITSRRGRYPDLEVTSHCSTTILNHSFTANRNLCTPQIPPIQSDIKAAFPVSNIQWGGSCKCETPSFYSNGRTWPTPTSKASVPKTSPLRWTPGFTEMS